MSKVNAQNWPQLDFLINNFYEIVEYKRGRGIYGDRVVFKRSKHAEAVFGEPQRLFEFYYMDANAVKELPFTIREKIKVITRMVVSPEDMNVLCDFTDKTDPAEWAVETSREFINAKTLDFQQLNDILLNRYKLLDSTFLAKLKKHREQQYFLASSSEFSLIPKPYADAQIDRL